MPDSPTRQAAVARLAELIKDVPIAMLTTTTERGWLRSRPMIVEHAAFDGDIWFFTGRSTAKARDLRNRQQVNIGYMSAERDRYVSVSGTALVIEDADRMKALWNNRYREWFPQGLDDPDLALIKVQVQEAEYWDRRQHRMVQVTGFVEPTTGFREPGTGV
jgi:general stress protein 26